MRSLFLSVLGYFLTPVGVALMGFLDASLVFFLPLGIDVVVIIVSARRPDLFWLDALLATLGSVAGAAGTFWIGRKAGEAGLRRFVSRGRLARVRTKIDGGAFVVAALALVPPPFPFTPFVLASGALGMHAGTFLSMLAGMRALRFGVEAALAAHYGSQILRWMRMPAFMGVIGAFIALALVGTIVSAIAMVRATRRRPPRRAAYTR